MRSSGPGAHARLLASSRFDAQRDRLEAALARAREQNDDVTSTAFALQGEVAKLLASVDDLRPRLDTSKRAEGRLGLELEKLREASKRDASDAALEAEGLRRWMGHLEVAVALSPRAGRDRQRRARARARALRRARSLSRERRAMLGLPPFPPPPLDFARARR